MSDPASIDQQIKRAHQVFKEQREEIELLKAQIKEAEKVIEHFIEDAPSNWSDHYRPAKEYLEKYK